ncbi:uncharacterized protein F4807DRAFT_440299 [Annulohypoxylon truncatum]|uniref:uncharacterized protein n=1 Tax=Annulohypoxylon truncatum TaxID=327061 RepID=UPI002007B3BE|nr:uncharacterized protein F4807DRAFT_440299 [Annulohypoxylon truncatum]KAI1206210.1 hypothetical protein F4807DRAFT_440299 [Annulohypoxylon truncatum]
MLLADEPSPTTPSVVILPPADPVPLTTGQVIPGDYASGSDTVSKTATTFATGWIIGIVLMVLVVILAIIVALTIYRRRSRRHGDRLVQSSAELSNRDAPPRYETLHT